MHGTYQLIMLAAIAIGWLIYRRGPQPLEVSRREMAGIALGAFCGAMVGAKLPFVLADWQGFLSGTAWFDDGKTIMTGLVGGYLGAELAEWAMGVRVKLCDVFAVPAAAAVGVGRLACFAAGCCYGTVTSLAWGVDFGDGRSRHPTQLYESAFHLSMAVVLYQFQRREMFRGQLVRIYFLAYFAYRFLTEWIRPEARLWLGLTGYQWAALFLGAVFLVWGCPGCRPQAAVRWRGRGRELPPADPAPRKLADTTTLCPQCMEPMPGVIYERSGRVYLRRECPQHAVSEALVSSDRRHYYLRDEVPHPPPAQEACCSTGPAHRTCLALLEVTGACNLRCPICYAESAAGGHRPFEDVSADLARYLAERGPLDVLQLSGGEPLLHPELLRILDHVQQLPIRHVMINTNGLELARRADLAAELARRKPLPQIYFQLDGLEAEIHRTLRGADLVEEKRAALARLAAAQLPTTLVTTVVRGVNEDQMGDLVRFGLEARHVRGITFQPATACGRYDRALDPLDRVTLAEVIRLLAQQCSGLLVEDDFRPLPCSHPNCCSFTYIARPRRLPVLPVLRTLRYEEHVQRIADRVTFDLDDAQTCCGGIWRPEDFFRIAVKPFMDAYTYDRQRIDECCIHVIKPGGQAVSFCQFNTLQRGREPRPSEHVPEANHVVA